MRPSALHSGFTIIEVIVGMAILAIVSTALYLAYANTLDIVSAGQYHSVATNLIESEIETVRNMDYEDVGTIGGVPAGKLAQEKTITIDVIDFTVKTFVRNIDDPFDGTLGGSPNDTAPADYKLVEVQIECTTCPRFGLVRMTTTVAPRNLENADGTGNLFINVLDALGQPMADATVSVVNSGVSPAVDLTDITGANGQLQLVGVATSSAGYQISITRNGYSTDRTHTPGEPSNPNPTKPDVTVATEQLSIATFAIDQFASLQLATVDHTCAPVSGVDLLVTGTKLIGNTPDVPKYSVAHSTNSFGTLTLSALEWDSYTLTPTDSVYIIAGTDSTTPLALNPTDSASLTWLMTPIEPNALLVSVRDDAGLGIDDATVRLASGGYDQSVTSGRYAWTQADWSSGQFTNASGINTASSGILTLIETGGTYATNSYGWLESETVDFGAPAELFTIAWSPASQPSGVGSGSVRFQVAANNDGSSWTYVGPDGTAGTFFLSPDATELPSSLSGNRYVRYRAELRTLDTSETPSIQSVTLSYRPSCAPAGAALFTNVPDGFHTLSVTKSGYQDYTEEDVERVADWQEHSITLTP